MQWGQSDGATMDACCGLMTLLLKFTRNSWEKTIVVSYVEYICMNICRESAMRLGAHGYYIETVSTEFLFVHCSYVCSPC